jgi:hypothetical protein
MFPLGRFEAGYEVLERHTSRFAEVNTETLYAALLENGAALAPLRMVAGLTYNELGVAIELATGERIAGSALRKLEREAPQPASDAASESRRSKTLRLIAEAVIAVVARSVLEAPEAVRASFHSKLDKRDTAEGWASVRRDAAEGVPCSALLYQRYVGGLCGKSRMRTRRSRETPSSSNRSRPC